MTQPSALSPDSLHLGLLAADLTHQHGWAHYSLSLLQALRRAGVRVTVVAARNSPAIDGADVLPLLPTVEPIAAKMPLRLAQVARQTRHALAGCDLIHSAIEPYAPLAAWAAGSRPLVITGHGSYVRIGNVYRFPVRLAYEWAFRRALLVCVSRYTAKQAHTAVPGVRVEVVPNGIDVERFAAITHDDNRHPPTVLTVGAVKARKGTLALVRAMKTVTGAIPDSRCLIVGSLDMEPSYVAQVRAEIERLSLHDSVSLLGRVSNETLLNCYREADVFAMPSLNVGWKFEGYGLSLMEASAAGLPVIGSRDCGAEDAVNDGVTGLLVSQQQVDVELPQALVRLLSDRALARRMGEAGRVWARQHTWDRVAQQMIGIYRTMLGRPSSTP